MTPTIADVREEEVGSGEDAEDRFVLHFEDDTKPLVLNKTNGSVLLDAFGLESDDWIGKQVILYRDRTAFRGEMVDCLRLRISVDSPF